MSSRYIMPLEACEDPMLVGGKAAGLGRLLRHGFRVPPGLCLTTSAYQEALHEAGIDPDAGWRQIRQASAIARNSILAEWGHRVDSLVMPEPILNELSAWLDRLEQSLEAGGQPLWAVRSSASTEDDAETTSAGIYRTSLGVFRNEIPRAITRCWASLWIPTAVAYQEHAGKKRPGAPAMAVIVQPLLSPQAAGVAFSRHPLTGEQNLVVINAVPGLAEPLVSGAVAPDQFTVQTNGDGRPGAVLERDIAEKSFMKHPVAGVLQDIPLQDEASKTPSLSDQQAIALAHLAKDVEHTFAYPVDIEWAIDGSEVWLLQVRPIPRASRSALAEAACTWSRANFKETLPELPSPLGLSLLQNFMENNILRHYRQLGCRIPPGASSIRIVRGRPYINLTLFQSFMAQLGGDPTLVVEHMGGEAALAPTVFPRLPWWKLLRAGLLMEWKIRRAARRAPAWFAEMKRMGKRGADDLNGTLVPADISARLDQLGRRINAHDLTFAIVAGVSQGLQALGFLLERRIGPGWRPLLNAALQGQGDIISANHIIRLIELAELAREASPVRDFLLAERWTSEPFRRALAGTRFLESFEHYLNEYGHRAVRESDVMSPRFSEMPEYLLETIRRYLLAPSFKSAREIVHEQDQSREAALERIRAALTGPERVLFNWWYRRLCRYQALREANRHHLMYFSSAVRCLVLRLGEHLAAHGSLKAKDDVFFLTADEINAIASGAVRDWNSLVAVRRKERTQNAACTVPDVVTESAPRSLTSKNQTRPDVIVVTSDSLLGLPISAGYSEGPVCLVRSPDDFKKVKQGDILVTPVIDPGMAPLFGLAGGLIVEMGGTLSHGAIIAREYGIPTVANVLGATRLLKDGERVAVDAMIGEVRRVDVSNTSECKGHKTIK